MEVIPLSDCCLENINTSYVRTLEKENQHTKWTRALT